MFQKHLTDSLTNSGINVFCLRLDKMVLAEALLEWLNSYLSQRKLKELSLIHVFLA